MCIQANLLVLRHTIKRQGQIIGSPGHVTPSFFDILYSQEFCLSRPRHFFQKSTKKYQKNSRGCHPHPHLIGLRQSNPPGLGAICLFVPSLDGPDSALSHKSNINQSGAQDTCLVQVTSTANKYSYTRVCAPMKRYSNFCAMEVIANYLISVRSLIMILIIWLTRLLNAFYTNFS